MEPLTIAAGAALAVAGVDIAELAILGVGSVITLLVIFALVQAGLSVFYARALNNQVSQGIQAIVGVNNMSTVDQAMEDRKTRGTGGNAQFVNNNGSDDSDNGNSGQ
jgi:Na+-transporting methylmalonyl-CoA/oxaloacetate decarboxylase gamma subunit